ncbi:hypothetical protein D3C81_1876740 [compost metagenome]
MKEEAALAMAALGAANVADLWRCPVVIVGETAEWCRARGIHIDLLARRTRGIPSPHETSSDNSY